MRLLIAAALVAGMSTPLAAAEWCFENLGQTGCPWKETFPNKDLKKLACDNLWLVRNSMYDRHGYCFKTKKARETFDNSDCTVDDAADIDFNNHENANISRIVKIEKSKGC